VARADFGSILAANLVASSLAVSGRQLIAHPLGAQPGADRKNMEDKPAHLQMIQAVIARLSSNSFLINALYS